MIAARAILLSLAAASPAAAASHCTAGEQTMFSCATGGKIVSVCAAKRAVQYRFGPEGKPEMIWPPMGEGRDKVGSGLWAFAGGGGAWLAFHKDAYRYIVYSAVGKGWGRKAGVAVEQNGRLAANLPCKDKAISEIGPDFFMQAGIADDDAPFELP